MPFLVIAGITVPVAFDGAARRPIERGGFQGRAYAGNFRAAVRYEKRSWQLRTDFMLDADAVTLEAAVANGVQVVCSGDLIAPAGSVTCVVQVGESSILNSGSSDGKGFMRCLNLILIEA